MDIEYEEFSEKPSLYRFIHEKLRLIAEETSDFYAILSNAAALLRLILPDVNWAGFYLYKGGRLVLGPFQGKPGRAMPCTITSRRLLRGVFFSLDFKEVFL